MDQRSTNLQHSTSYQKLCVYASSQCRMQKLPCVYSCVSYIGKQCLIADPLVDSLHMIRLALMSQLYEAGRFQDDVPVK